MWRSATAGGSHAAGHAEPLSIFSKRLIAAEMRISAQRALSAAFVVRNLSRCAQTQTRYSTHLVAVYAATGRTGIRRAGKPVALFPGRLARTRQTVATRTPLAALPDVSVAPCTRGPCDEGEAARCAQRPTATARAEEFFFASGCVIAPSRHSGTQHRRLVVPWWPREGAAKSGRAPNRRPATSRGTSASPTCERVDARP